MAHPMLVTVSAAAVTLAGVGLIAHHRVHYWKQWGLDLFDQFYDTMLDRLDVDLDLTELTT